MILQTAGLSIRAVKGWCWGRSAIGAGATISSSPVESGCGFSTGLLQHCRNWAPIQQLACECHFALQFQLVVAAAMVAGHCEAGVHVCHEYKCITSLLYFRLDL